MIDLANWYLQGHPVKAFGTGGRTDWSGTQWNVLDGWDHFLVTYWYPHGVQLDFSSTQLHRSFGACHGLGLAPPGVPPPDHVPHDPREHATNGLLVVFGENDFLRPEHGRSILPALGEVF